MPSRSSSSWLRSQLAKQQESGGTIIFFTALRSGRALLRASAYGSAAIMFPMISGLTELRDDARRVLDKNYPNSAYLTHGLRGADKPWWQLW